MQTENGRLDLEMFQESPMEVVQVRALIFHQWKVIHLLTNYLVMFQLHQMLCMEIILVL